MAKHALLSPSSASRWLTCSPSARLEAKLPEVSSTYADEGTLAHELSELMIKYRLNRVTKKEYIKALLKIEAADYYNTEMHNYAEGFADFVLELYSEELEASGGTAELFTETRVSLIKYTPDCWGTLDIRISWRKRITVIDLKYGRGVQVSAVDNKQLFVYGLGAIEELRKKSKIYPDLSVRMIIYQPRIDNITETEVAGLWLMSWAEKILIPGAAKAYSGKGQRVAGDHCQFCKLKADCRAHYTYQIETVKKVNSAPDNLNSAEIAKIILNANKFENFLTQVKTFALEEALKKKRIFPGLKVVESKSTRRIKDENAVVKVLTEDYFFSEEELFNKSLKGITEFTKLLGAANFRDAIEPLLHKPPGTPILVPENDKRKTFDPNDRALKDFAQFED